jgi:tetratricopeptide (TPR) repeat protein
VVPSRFRARGTTSGRDTKEKHLAIFKRIRNLLFMLMAVAAWTLVGSPVGHAADAPGTAKTDLAQQEKQLREALSADPNDAAAHLKLGNLYLEQGRYPAAVDQAKAAKQGGGHNDEADALLAWTLFLSNEGNALLKEIKPGDREAHSESIVRMSLGLACINPLELDCAGPLLSTAVQLDSNSWRARIGYARFLMLKRRLPEAREQIEAARSLGPNEVGVMRIAAELDRAEGNTDAAIAGFTKVLELSPGSVPSLAGRADALISQNKLSEAQNDLTAAVKRVRHPQLLFLEALILVQQNKLADADHLLGQASPVFARMRIGFYLHAVVKFRLGAEDTATFYLSKFQGQQPSVPAAAHLLAEMALHRKDAVTAIKLLEPMVEANPLDQEAVTRLARAYLLDGKPERVIVLYQQTTAAPVRRVTPGLDVAGFIMMYGDAVGDLTEIEKIIMVKAPELVMPMIALRQGDVDKAALLAEPLAEKNPSNPVIQDFLGSVRLAQKRFSEAEQIFRQVVEKNPDFMPAAFNLIGALVASNKQQIAQWRLEKLAQRAAAR